MLRTTCLLPDFYCECDVINFFTTCFWIVASIKKKIFLRSKELTQKEGGGGQGERARDGRAPCSVREKNTPQLT